MGKTKSEVKLATYRLLAPYWDGQRLHEIGNLHEFTVGQAPKDSAELTPAEAKEARLAAVQSVDDPVQVVLAGFRAEIDELTARLDILE